jgi:hypothetical protein
MTQQRGCRHIGEQIQTTHYFLLILFLLAADHTITSEPDLAHPELSEVQPGTQGMQQFTSVKLRVNLSS